MKLTLIHTNVEQILRIYKIYCVTNFFIIKFKTKLNLKKNVIKNNLNTKIFFILDFLNYFFPINLSKVLNYLPRDLFDRTLSE
jgi:hypothetical protein